jgi:hypothetical protein
MMLGVLVIDSEVKVHSLFHLIKISLHFELKEGLLVFFLNDLPSS